jgi:hypothetical protein
MSHTEAKWEMRFSVLGLNIKRFGRVGPNGSNCEKWPFLIFSPLLYQLSYLAGAKEGAQKKGAV